MTLGNQKCTRLGNTRYTKGWEWGGGLKPEGLVGSLYEHSRPGHQASFLQADDRRAHL